MIMTRACEKCLRIFQCYDGVKHSCGVCNSCVNPRINTIVTGLCPKCKEAYDQERKETKTESEASQASRKIRAQISLGLCQSDDSEEKERRARQCKILLSRVRNALLPRV